MKFIFLILLTMTTNANASRATADCSSTDGKITASIIMKGLSDIPDLVKVQIDETTIEMQKLTSINMIGMQRQFSVGAMTFIQYKTSSHENADGLMVFDLNGVSLGNMKCCFDGTKVNLINGTIICT